MISITISLLWVIACLFWFYHQDRKRGPALPIPIGTDLKSSASTDTKATCQGHPKTKVRDPVRNDPIEQNQEIHYSIFKP